MFALTLKRLVGGCTPEPRPRSSFPDGQSSGAFPSPSALTLGRERGRRMPGNRPTPSGSASRSTRSPCILGLVHYRWVVLHTPPRPGGRGKGKEEAPWPVLRETRRMCGG